MEASKITDEETIKKINDIKKIEFENINKKNFFRYKCNLLIESKTNLNWEKYPNTKFC